MVVMTVGLIGVETNLTNFDPDNIIFSIQTSNEVCNISFNEDHIITGRGLPYGSGLGLSRCLGPGECLHSFIL